MAYVLSDRGEFVDLDHLRIDKWKAKRRAWRIPERTLLLLAAAGGCTGALAGMLMFRHKTRKLKFMIGVPVIFVVESISFAYIFLRL
jgi:uncharacterized membrane protein YsdA (DUF1294 family)